MLFNEKYNTKKPDYYIQSRNEMLSYIPVNVKRLLDIGCSGGSFGRSVKEKYGTEVWGIEPFDEAAKEAGNYLDKVIHGLFDYNSLELKGQKFDCIVLNDVLEHLISPEKVLKECRSLLGENGIVVASIPNILFSGTNQ